MKYLLTGQEMKIWEKKAMETYKIPSILLMERAAQSVVKAILQKDYALFKVLVVCGSGNNGGDGLAVARMLKQRGLTTEVCMIGDLKRATPETKLQLEMYEAISGKFVTSPPWDEYTVIVDGIFGIGCNREITGEAAEMINEINRSKAKVVAIDVPSGISADTGKICGCCVKADVTVTFFTKKLGMVLDPGREACGEIRVESLEVPFRVTEECNKITYTEEDIELLPRRELGGHKGTFGKVLIIGGSKEICGAAFLAAAGAYRMGAGLVKIFSPAENKQSLQVLLPEALLSVYDTDNFEIEKLDSCMAWADTIVIGPGIGTGETAERMLLHVLENSSVPVVADADAINLLAGHPELLKEVRVPVVLTPHIQEMVRLSGRDKGELLEHSMDIAKGFAEEYPVILVLKNARTIVASKNELLYINTSGNSGMATGGSGDVLAGIIAGLMAQGMEAAGASRLGVYLHGAAGDRAAEKKGAYSMLASDLLDGISEVTR